jgi:hypothetical protein
MPPWQDGRTQWNPDFDPAAYSARQPGAVIGEDLLIGPLGGAHRQRPLRRGWIAQVAQPGQTTVYGLQFLYNPSVLSITRSLDNNTMVYPTYMQTANSNTAGQYLVPLNATASFDLFFNRTYELWYMLRDIAQYDSGLPVTFDQAQALRDGGVQVDIDAAYRICGVLLPSNPATITGADQKPVAFTGVKTITGPMTMNPVHVNFGGPTGQLYGWISSLNAQITMWSQDMVPMCATLSVVLTLLPEPA